MTEGSGEGGGTLDCRDRTKRQRASLAASSKEVPLSREGRGPSHLLSSARAPPAPPLPATLPPVLCRIMILIPTHSTGLWGNYLGVHSGSASDLLRPGQPTPLWCLVPSWEMGLSGCAPL